MKYVKSAWVLLCALGALPLLAAEAGGPGDLRSRPEAALRRHGCGPGGASSDHWIEEFYWWLEAGGLVKAAH